MLKLTLSARAVAGTVATETIELDDQQQSPRPRHRLLLSPRKQKSPERPARRPQLVQSDSTQPGSRRARLAAESSGRGYSMHDARGVHDPRPGRAFAARV